MSEPDELLVAKTHTVQQRPGNPGFGQMIGSLGLAIAGQKIDLL
ncbi:MAG: hypothetical protein WBS33_08705 [Verrucomicrobiia bacterium]